MRCRIGVYSQYGDLIGYKADTFWTLVKNPEYAKIDTIVNGQIRPHLITNLSKVLYGQIDTSSAIAEVLSTIEDINKNAFFNHSYPMLIGYESLEENSNTIFTHKILSDRIEPLSSE